MRFAKVRSALSEETDGKVLMAYLRASQEFSQYSAESLSYSVVGAMSLYYLQHYGIQSFRMSVTVILDGIVGG